METLSFDLEYLCSKMTDMSGLPIRIYEKGSLKNRFSVVPFTADPAEAYLDIFVKKTEHVSYYISERFNYYGIIVSDSTMIVIGPGYSTSPNNQEMHDLAFELNVTNKDYEAFSLFMKSINPMPLDSIIQMMCTINHIINGEQLHLSDFHLKSSLLSDSSEYRQHSTSSDIYKNYNIEKQILDLIKNGDTVSLEMWAKQAPSVKGGKLSDNLFRQMKNTFIVTTTLACRAAVESGVNIEEAFRLSDYFIQKCENCSYSNDLNSLQYEMISTYTREVGNVKNLTTNARLSRDVYNYIIQHISNPIKTGNIADALYMSRSHLSTVFKKETGINLNVYIHQIKTEKAKELLRDNTKSITLISDYLGYSSSSHFNRIFKQIAGTTPKDYRKTIEMKP